MSVFLTTEVLNRTPTELTGALQKEGVDIVFDSSVEAIPADFRDNPDGVLVVYTPALPDSHPQLSYFRERGKYVIYRVDNLFVSVAKSHLLYVSGQCRATRLKMRAVTYCGRPANCMPTSAEKWPTNIIMARGCL